MIRSGDGLLGPRADLPNEVVGHMVVIGTREHTSTAVITDTGVDLRTGDRIRTTEPL